MPPAADLPQVHLARDAERAEAADLLASRSGGRVGLDGVLGDLNRSARHQPIPGRKVSSGFALDLRDSRSRRWWPQGITSSADHSAGETYAGRRIVVTSSYSRTVNGLNKGARLTFFDVTEPRQVRYRHVLLVDASVHDGRLALHPLRVHAGGIVWHGGHLHVAATTRGLCTFHLDDVVPVAPGSPRDALGTVAGGRLAGFGHRYLLPVRFRYHATAEDGQRGLRYSFLSLDRSGDTPCLIAGEYAHDDHSARFARFELEAGSGLLKATAGAHSYPVSMELAGVRRLQGAVTVDGRWYATQSHGRWARGSLWVGQPGRLQENRRALPQGPEDLCYWPSTDRLWTVAEHPWLRYVAALDRASCD